MLYEFRKQLWVFGEMALPHKNEVQIESIVLSNQENAFPDELFHLVAHMFHET